MRLVERYEGRLRIESGFVDDTDADAFAPMMIRAAVVAGDHADGDERWRPQAPRRRKALALN
jgi:hypothetical protein